MLFRIALLLSSLCLTAAELRAWKRHVIADGFVSQTAIAADFTGDGRIDVVASDITAKEERVILFVAPDWKPVVLHRGADLPAIRFLTDTVELILEDGRITPAERRGLHLAILAIERVLPPDERQLARIRRQNVDEAERAEAAISRARNASALSLNFMVAGVHFESRYMIIAEHVVPRICAYLVRDRENQHSRNAVEVRLRSGHLIGYAPESYDAPKLAPLLDTGHRHAAYVTKVLSGGRAPIPVVQAEIYSSEADSGVTSDEVPPALQGVGSGREGTGIHLASRSHSASSGCASTVLLISGLGLSLIWFAAKWL